MSGYADSIEAVLRRNNVHASGSAAAVRMNGRYHPKAFLHLRTGRSVRSSMY